MNKIVVGNWKMNGSRSLIDAVRCAIAPCAELPSSNRGVVCPPYPLIPCAVEALSPLVSVGAQDCSACAPGAYTGEVSGEQLRDVGATFVIVGHSERRRVHKECGELISQKVQQALRCGLIPIVCIGESHDDYAAGHTRQVLLSQLEQLRLGEVGGYVTSTAGAHTLLVAYEPVWAIGTGCTPSLKEIDDVHRFIFDTCGAVPLYGGSVTADNYAPILELDSVGGLLVGGESLKPERFATILSNGKYSF
ncbi:MAG: triose-phosphate isomerase [Holosporales bacterium]|jgi:triosephosphate isomerase|nr:triose-phosphate isomerase [Holosporales bacterium]